MGRKRQVLLLFASVILLGGLYMNTFGRYFTSEGVFYACERGLHYGPSERILKEYKNSQGDTVIIGKCENGLSIINAERKMFGLWVLSDGMITGLVPPNDGEDILFIHNYKDNVIMGITGNNEIKSVNVSIKSKDSGRERIFDIKTDDDGFFFLENIEEIEQGETFYIVTARDEEGKNIEMLKMTRINNI